MDLDKFINDFVKESIKLTKDIKKKGIPTLLTYISSLKKKLRENHYYLTILIIGIGMLFSLILYLKLPENNKLSNIAGNTFIGLLTGLILAIVANIKNKEINYNNNIFEFYSNIIDDIKNYRSYFYSLFTKSPLNTYDISILLIKVIDIFTSLGHTNKEYKKYLMWYCDFVQKYNIEEVHYDLQLECTVLYRMTNISKDEFLKEYLPKICEINFIIDQLELSLKKEWSKILKNKGDLEKTIL